MSSDNIKIRQTWIEDEIEKCKKELGEKKDDVAFLHLVCSLILECQIDDIDPTDIVDGGFDKQIDFIKIDDDDERGHATISIVQSKNSKGFESNIVIQIRNGLDWIFERPKAEIETLQNDLFKNKILEIREMRSQYGATNLDIHVYHVTKGSTSDLSDEYLGEAKVLREKYENLGFGDFVFKQVGAHEIIEMINEGDRAKRQIDVELPVLYDINRPSVMKYDQGDTSSLICTVKGSDLAVMAAVEPRDAIFDLNVRPYYGSRGKVNKDIWKTSTGDEAARFWFLNNGVTMVCDRFDFTSDPDKPVVKITNAQIVNGCQTTVTIREAYEKSELNSDVKVLVRIYSTDNPNLIDKITLTTNNQNRITDRDLRANDDVQRDIGRVMEEKYNHFYERKNRQYKNLKGPDRAKIVPSPKAAQAYLAVVRRKPSNARGYLAAVWSDFYGEIFQNASVADLLLSFKILGHCQKRAKLAKADSHNTAVMIETRVYGSIHVARAMGYFLLADKWGNANLGTVEKMLSDKALEDKLSIAYDKAVTLVSKLRTEDKVTDPVPALYFKNSNSQKRLNASIMDLAKA